MKEKNTVFNRVYFKIMVNVEVRCGQLGLLIIIFINDLYFGYLAGIYLFIARKKINLLPLCGYTDRNPFVFRRNL